MANRYEKCVCCMSPAGGFDYGFKLVYGQRLVEAYGKKFYQFYCSLHAKHAPELIKIESERSRAEAPRYHKVALLAAIQRLDATRRSYTVSQLIKEAGLSHQKYYQANLQDIGSKAALHSKEIEYEARIEDAIAELEQRNVRGLCIVDVLTVAGVTWHVYQERCNLKLLVERAIVASGGTVRTSRGGRRRAA